MEKLVKKGTGCAKVVVFDHTLRVSSVTKLNSLGEKGQAAGAVARVHTDYTANSAPRRVLDLANKGSYTGTKMDPAEVEALMQKRFTFINIWRSTKHERCVRKPMTFCDTRSVSEEDFQYYKMKYPDRIGEIHSLYSDSADKHKWYYYPQMLREEAVIFKCYDKKEDGPRFCFHTAFDHPNTPEDAGDRVSLECRAIAFFDE